MGIWRIRKVEIEEGRRKNRLSRREGKRERANRPEKMHVKTRKWRVHELLALRGGGRRFRQSGIQERREAV